MLFDGIANLISNIHYLTGINHVLGLGTTKGHVHIRAGGGILHSGSQLAFEILVLDGLNLNLDTGLLLKRFGQILPILLAVTSCCVMPERNGLIVFGAALEPQAPMPNMVATARVAAAMVLNFIVFSLLTKSSSTK